MIKGELTAADFSDKNSGIVRLTFDVPYSWAKTQEIRMNTIGYITFDPSDTNKQIECINTMEFLENFGEK